MRWLRRVLLILILLGGLTVPVLAFNDAEIRRFSVLHDHLFGEGDGELFIGPEGIRFEGEEEDHTREWSYTDIQELRIESPTRLRIMGYEDVKWKLNRDRVYRFRLVEGEITTDLVEFLRTRLPRPPVTSVFEIPAVTRAEIPVKHRHSLGGGCEGVLLITDEAVVFESQQDEHSRIWDQDLIQEVGRESNFDLRLEVLESSIHGSRRPYRFQLKRPLEDEIFEWLWRQVYEPDTWLSRY